MEAIHKSKQEKIKIKIGTIIGEQKIKEPRKKKKEDGKQGNEIKKIRKKVILGKSTFPFQLNKNLTN